MADQQKNPTLKIVRKYHKNKKKSSDGLWESFVDMRMETTNYVVEAASVAWTVEGFS